MRPTEFLRLLFAGALPQDYLTLWATPSKRSHHLPLHELDEGACAQGDNHALYYGVGLKHRIPERRGKKADVCALPGIWLDLDVQAPPGVHAAQDALPTEDQALALVDELGPPPTILISSGWGYHVWWLFPQVVREPHAVERLAGAMQRRARELGAARGWHVDLTADMTRVLRLPGTVNRACPDQPRPCEVLLADGPRYAVDHLQSLFSQYVESKKTVPVDRAPRGGDLVDRLLHHQSPAVQLLLAGEPFARPGERDSTLASLTQTVANLAPDGDLEELAALFERSIDAMWEGVAEADSDNPPPGMDDVRAKLGTALGKKRAERERDAEVCAAIARGVARASASSDDYSDEDLARWAREQGVSPRGLRKRWVIQHGSSYYVFVDGNYRPPIVKEALAVSLPRDLAAAPIDWTAVKADGSARPKKVNELLDDYATVARKVVADLTLERSYYSPDGEVFFEAVCPPRGLEPVYDPQVDEWLRLLGGEEAEKLLDWVATVTSLEWQSCALYMTGPRDTGKTMLAHGLARLWTTGAPTELASVLSSFNSALLNCPLIFADEYIPQGFRGQHGSAELRQLVGSSARTLRRKNIPDADLRGAIRLILAANNERLLALDEDLSKEDKEAVAGRFLHVWTPPEASRYLDDLGGRGGTADWVSGDRIARHALWLRRSREVVPGSRFLVEGREGELVWALATQGRVPGLVTEWLARFLAKWAAAPLKCPVRVGGGELLVNASAVVEHWGTFVPKQPAQPSTTAIGRALAGMALGEKKIDGVRYHSIKPDVVYNFAVRNQIGDVDAMRAWVQMGVVPSPQDPSPTDVRRPELDKSSEDLACSRR